MIVNKRMGDWVVRVYIKNPGENFKVVSEQYYPTRAEMREGIKLWKDLTFDSESKIKIRTYRICAHISTLSAEAKFCNTVMYKEAR